MSSNPLRSGSVSDNTFITNVITEFGHYTNASQSIGFQTNRTEKYLSQPYTLSQFISNAVLAAKSAWNDEPDAPHTTSVTCPTDDDRRCATVKILRYRLEFNSEAGFMYHFKWQVRMTAGTTTKVISDNEWRGFGTGTRMVTDWIEAPVPEADKSYSVEVVITESNAYPRTNPDVPGTFAGGGSCGTGKCGMKGQTGAGQVITFLKSAGFLVPLGVGSIDQSAGSLILHEDVPSAALATPSALRFEVNRDVVTLQTNQDDTIIVFAPTLLAWVAATNDYAYWITCYAKENGQYQTNTPFLSHLIVNPNGSTNANTLRLVSLRGSVAVTNEFTCEANNATNQTWCLISGNGLKGERLIKSVDTNSQTRLESYRIFDPASQQQLHRRDELYQILQYGERLLSATLDPEGLGLVTTNTYDSLGRLLLTVNPDGSWTRNEYDANGVLLRTVRPVMDEAPDAAAADCRVTEYSYSSIPNSPDDANVRKGSPRSVEEYLQGEWIGATLYAYPTEHQTYTQVALSAQFANWNDPYNQCSYSQTDDAHRLIRSDHSDGTRTQITYTDNQYGRLTTTYSGVYASTQFTAGTRTEEQVDTLGRPIYRKTYDIASSLLVAEETYSEPDAFGRPAKVTYLDGTTTEDVRQDCCQSAYTVDREGVRTDYYYDALNRLQASVRLGLTNFNRLDAADRLWVQSRHGSNATEVLLRQVAYDAAGRVIRETNALGAVTTISDTLNANLQRVVSITQPDGGTRTNTYYRSRALAKTTGTAVDGVRYTYGIKCVLAGWYWGYTFACTRVIRLDASGADTSEWTETLANASGQTLQTIWPDDSFAEFVYNNAGQMIWSTDPDGFVTVYGYNALGERTDTALDLDPGGEISYATTDRITRTTNYVSTRSGLTVRVHETWVWPVWGNDTALLVSRTESAVNGTRVWQSVFQDGNPITAETQVAWTPTQNGLQRTVTQIAPDSTKTVSVYLAGRLQSVTRLDSADAQIGGVTYAYDAHGRQYSVTDARNGASTFLYNGADLVVTNTAPPADGAQSAQTIAVEYNALGRAVRVIQPDGQSVTNEYNLHGQRIKTSGAREYPVAYGYDYAGRLSSMVTWQNHASSNGAAVTTWIYDSQRGWLNAKRYADKDTGQAGAVGTDYTYTPAGRLLTRTWARGITATYGNDGFTESINYSDTTPGVSITLDRLGRRERLDDSAGNTIALYYNSLGQATTESHDAGPLAGLALTRNYDSLGRPSGLSLNTQPSTVDQTYAYNAAGRLAVVSDGTVSAGYSYLANSPLVEYTYFTNGSTHVMTTSRTYDYLNRLRKIEALNAQQSTVLNSFAYAYNTANQRTAVTNVDSSRWAFGYDPLGQVTSGKKYWSDNQPVAGQQFEYEFDDIGNRQWARSGGDNAGANLRQATYTANFLNQYASRTVPGSADIVGTATNTATVSANLTASARHGDYYRVNVAANNTTGAVWQAVEVVGVLQGTSTNNPDLLTTNTGNLFFPRTPEAFAYDADGNLTSDGRFSYTWDAENRLVQVESHATNAAGSKVKVTWAYDPLGRRVRQTEYDGSTGSYAVVQDLKLVYDGWQCLAELNATNDLVIRSYLWGLDLSGTRTGAGGVGGLLAIHSTLNAQPSTHFYSYDGNGNVTALVKASDGTISANYEYGPFGETIRATGPMADENAFQFSTKRMVRSLGVVLYEFRGYSPVLGRWLSRDPIGERGGANLRGFVRNRTLNRIDYLGLAPVESSANSSQIIHSDSPVLGPDEVKWGGESIGTVSVFLNAGYQVWNPVKKIWVMQSSGGISIEFHPFSAKSPPECKWIQFVTSDAYNTSGVLIKWLVPVYSSKPGTLDKYTNDAGGTQYYVDTGSSMSPFYLDSGGAGVQSADEMSLYDAPGGPLPAKVQKLVMRFSTVLLCRKCFSSSKAKYHPVYAVNWKVVAEQGKNQIYTDIKGNGSVVGPYGPTPIMPVLSEVLSLGLNTTGAEPKPITIGNPIFGAEQ